MKKSQVKQSDNVYAAIQDTLNNKRRTENIVQQLECRYQIRCFQKFYILYYSALKNVEHITLCIIKSLQE